MSRSYKFHDPEGIYFISFATVQWVDVFTRREYKDIVVESNHVHMIAAAAEGHALPDILRDLKKYTASQILNAITENSQESRKQWMLPIFSKAGAANPNNTHYQFWRQDDRPIQLISAAVFGQKLNYLHENPVVEGYVEQAEDYVYCSAPAIAGKPGMLKLEPY